jgi:C-terminal processing protease CtpA/Prc
MALEPNPDFALPFCGDTAGLLFAVSGPEMETVSIAHVLANTPAAAAGIRTGDIVVQVNGQDAQHLGLEGLRTLFSVTGTYHLEFRRQDQSVEVELSSNKQLY